MDFNLMDFIGKYKNKILNIAIIIVALIISQNIYKNQAKNTASLLGRKDEEIKKNAELEEISQLQDKFNAIKQAINNKDISLVPRTISSTAEYSAIRIVSLKPQREEPYPLYVKYPFDLVLVATDYHRLGKFISRIEDSADIYVVENINIRSIPEEQKQNKVDTLVAELRLSTILIKD
jgi:hypothetical protein